MNRITEELAPDVLMATTREIHFYPKDKLLAVFDITPQGRIAVYVIEAWGGPEHGGHDPRMRENPTTEGRFVIGAVEAYQMIHTTPENEADTAMGRAFSLTESHGCIHIRPADRDKLMQAGVFKLGVPFVVHSYRDIYPYGNIFP